MQAVFQVRHRCGQLLNHCWRQLSIGAPQAVPPALLPLLKMQGLQRLVNSLMGGKAGPFMVAGLSAEAGLGQVCLGLMQPIQRTIHRIILNWLRDATPITKPEQHKRSASTAPALSQHQRIKGHRNPKLLGEFQHPAPGPIPVAPRADNAAEYHRRTARLQGEFHQGPAD